MNETRERRFAMATFSKYNPERHCMETVTERVEVLGVKINTPSGYDYIRTAAGVEFHLSREHIQPDEAG